MFVPAVFLVMDDVAKGLWWVFGRFVGKTDEPEAAVAAPTMPPVPAVLANEPRVIVRPIAAE